MKLLFALIMFTFILSQPCFASNAMDMLYPASELEEAKSLLPDTLIEIIENYRIPDGQGLENCILQLREYCKSVLILSAQSIVQPLVHIMVIIILCSLLEPLFYGKVFPLYLFGSIELLYIALVNSKTFFQEGIAALQSLYSFSTVLLPCLAATSVAAGASISAGVKYTAAALFMNILLNVSNTILMPIISIYLASAIGNSIFEQKILSVIADFIQWGSKTILTASTVIFTAYLNIAGLITGTSDIFALRVTKTAINGVLPVVGNIISGAASSLVAGAAILRNSIGVFGLLSVIGILIVPFIHLTLRYFAFIAMSKLAAFFPNRHFSYLIGGIANTYGMMLGVIGTGFIMIFLTLISFMQILGG